MPNLFSVPKLLCLDTLFLFCGPVAAKMKQRDEKWHYQDFLDLAVAPFPGVSSDSWGTQQLLAEVEGAISEQANTAWRSPAESKQSPAAKERNTQPPLPSLKKDILCIKSHPKAGGNERKTLKPLQVPCNTCFCKTWRTQVSFWLFELFGLGSAALGMKGAIATLYIDVIAKQGCHKMLSKLLRKQYIYTNNKTLQPTELF